MPARSSHRTSEGLPGQDCLGRWARAAPSETAVALLPNAALPAATIPSRTYKYMSRVMMSSHVRRVVKHNHRPQCAKSSTMIPAIPLAHLTCPLALCICISFLPRTMRIHHHAIHCCSLRSIRYILNIKIGIASRMQALVIPQTRSWPSAVDRLLFGSFERGLYQLTRSWTRYAMASKLLIVGWVCRQSGKGLLH